MYIRDTLYFDSALEASMMRSLHSPTIPVAPLPVVIGEDEQLLAVLKLSERQAEEAEKHRSEEELQLQQILELSLTDK